MKALEEIYQYREMIVTSIQRELRGRYKGSILGFLWTFINPLLQLAVYTMVFSVVLRAGIEKYYLFLFVALIPWIFFSTSLSGGASCIYTQAGMITKIYFPRQILPISFVTTCFVNMLLSFVVVLLVCAFSIGLDILLLPYLIPAMVIEYFLALGITLVISSVTVFFRDLEHITGILTMAWQFLTPVMYPLDAIPSHLRPVFGFNPMTPIITTYRSILYYKIKPDLGTLLVAVLWAFAFLAIGILVFNRLQRHFAEVL